MKQCYLTLMAVVFTAVTALGQNRTIPASVIETVTVQSNALQHTQTYLGANALTNINQNHTITEKYPALQSNIVIPTTVEKCKQSTIEHALLQDPAYAAGRERADNQVRRIISEWERGVGGHRLPPVYTIPVVFHVIHKGEAVGSGTNISDAQILSAVDALNRDYRRTSADGGIAQGAGPDTEIQFCLAQRDPNGNPSTGINRVDGTSVSGYSGSGITNSNEVNVKNLSRWDNRYYLNIWVVSEIDNNGADLANPSGWGGGTLGYAYLPTNPVTLNSQRDGIVAVNLCVGNDPNQTQGYRLWPWGGLTNRTLTHEVGHYLDLHHTFEGGSCSETNCNTQGDEVCDTPPTAQGNSCTNAVCTGAIVENYMDYTSETCQDMFTAGQTTRMRAAIAGPRSDLITSNGCTPVNNLDIAVTTITEPQGTLCTTSFDPIVEVTNFGSSTVTSFTLTYDIDGTGAQTFNWVGSLASGAVEVINLNTMTTTVGAHTFNAATSLPNGSTDQNTSNDANSSAFSAISGNTLNLTIITDQYGDETTWQIVDGTSTIVASGGPYNQLGASGTTTHNESVCLPNGCYDITFFDSYGDGMCCAYGNGSWTLEDGSANVLASGGTFTSQETVNFCVPVGPSAPVADFVANVTTIPVGGTVDFTDLSTASPAITTWAWTFTGAATTTSSVQNPTGIQYNNAGLYTVSLTVTNSAGNDTETKTNYIEVVPPSAGGACDTARNYTLGETITGYGLNGFWGYYPGHNEIGWTAYADPYTTVQPSNVQAVWVPVLIADDLGTANTFTVDVYSDNSGVPGTIIGSETVNISDMAAGAYNFVQFTTPVAVSGNYWVGVGLSYPATTDTVLFGTAANRPTGPSTTYIYDGTNWASTDATFGGGLLTSLGFDVLLSSGGTNTTFTQSANTICEGETVDLDGTGSSNTTAYLWDLAGATPNVSGDSALTASYATPGTYDIKLYTQGGCLVDSMISQITVNASPSANGVTTPAGCGVSNGSITITATGGTPPYQYSIDNGVTFQGSGTFSGLGAGNYDVVVVDQNGAGCSSAPTTLTVGSSSGPTINNSAGTNVNCNNGCDGTITITSTGGTSPIQYSIDGGTTFQASNTFNMLCAGTYPVVVEDASGCQVTDQVVLTEPGAIAVNNTVQDAGCGGNTGSITVSATGGTSPLTYSIDNGATYQSSNVFSGLAAGTYDVIVLDANGCTSTAVQETVSGGAGLTLSSTQNDETCGAANGDATVTVTGGSGNLTYSWTNGGTTASISGLSAGTYTVTVTDASGCTETLSVTITNSGGVNGTVSPNSSICTGGTEVLTASGGTSYSWSDGTSNVGSGSTITVTPSQTTTYTVTITDASGCSEQLTTTVTVNAVPNTQVSNDVTICNGETTTLTASGGTSYFWNTGDSTATLDVSPSQTTVYTVIAYNGSCAGNMQTVTVTVDPAAVAVAGADFTTVYLSSGATVNFTSTGSFGTTYAWNFGDGNTSTSNNPTHSYSNVGVYTVVLTSTLGNCTDMDTIMIEVLLVDGLEESALGNSISFFPNPSDGMVNMSVDMDKAENLTVTVYNGIGQIIYTEQHPNVSNGQFSYDLRSHAEGFYFIHVSTETEAYTQRILLKH